MQRKILAGLVLLAALVSACAKPPERKVEEVPPAVLKVAVLESAGPLFDAWIAGFQAEHANVIIERVAAPSTLDTEAMYRFRSDGTADVVTAGLGMARNLVDLEPYIARDRLDLAPYGRAMATIRAEGVVHGLPSILTGMMMGYNKQHVEAAGVRIPNQGWTWDEFRAVAKALTRETPEGLRPALVYERPEDLLDIYIEQKTGRPAWQADEKTLQDALAFFDTLINTDKSLAPVKRRDLLETGVVTHLGREFSNGQVTLSPVYVSGLKLRWYEFPYDVVPMPSHTPEQRLSEGTFVLLSITEGSANPDLAWEFVKYAAGPEGAKRMALAGYLPVYNVPDWVPWLRENLPDAPEAIYSLYETKWTFRRSVNDDGTRYQAYLNAANRVMSGNASAGVAVADWKQAIEK